MKSMFIIKFQSEDHFPTSILTFLFVYHTIAVVPTEFIPPTTNFQNFIHITQCFSVLVRKEHCEFCMHTSHTLISLRASSSALKSYFLIWVGVKHFPSQKEHHHIALAYKSMHMKLYVSLRQGNFFNPNADKSYSKIFLSRGNQESNEKMQVNYGSQNGVSGSH